MKIQNIDNKYDVIVFDFDNTLFDYEKTESEALFQVFHKLNIPFKNEYLVLFKKINRNLWEETEKDNNFDKVNLRLRRFSQLFTAINYNYSDETIRIASEIYIQNSSVGYLIDGVFETFKSLESYGIILCIASAGLSDSRKAKLANSNINSFIDCAFFREDFENDKIKPHSDFYMKIARKYQIPCSKMLYVGDTFSSDVKGAKLAGFTSVWFNYFNIDENSVEMEYCDYVIYNFKDLLKIIDN